MSNRLVVIVALAAVIALVGLGVALVASDDDDRGGGRGRTEIAAGAPTCSASDAGTELEQPNDMPDAVYEAALSVARAATACDYDELARLAGPDFQFSFGGVVGGEAAVEEWRAAEARGEPVLRTLHDLLVGRYVFDGERFVWPSTDTVDWRTGIGTAGDWQFFVAGD